MNNPLVNLHNKNSLLIQDNLLSISKHNNIFITIVKETIKLDLFNILKFMKYP